MAKSKNQRRSKLQEQRIAGDIGGRVQAGSGTSWRAKSDVRKMGDLRVEAKFTSKVEYTLKLDDWEKIWEEAVGGGLETPVMQIEYTRTMTSYRLAVMDYRLFRHWHGYAVTKTIIQNEYWTDAKSFGLDCYAAQAFFKGATEKGGDGVMQLCFDKGPQDKTYLAITEWPLFTSLHEAQEP
jgi:hypothetical protein